MCHESSSQMRLLALWAASFLARQNLWSYHRPHEPFSKDSRDTPVVIATNRSKKRDICIGSAPLSTPMYVQLSKGDFACKARRLSATSALRNTMPDTTRTVPSGLV
uniref:Uncharacterized protein n=1 Tax=Ixodes ricinus TaxID=34613 RepID=A0A6B0U956_IXORI